MKKYLAIILGAVFVLGFAASAFAIHAEIPAETQAVVAKGSTQISIGGDIRVRGEATNNTSDFNDDKADHKEYYDERVRLTVDAQVTPNTRGLVTIEASDGPTTTAAVWGTDVNGSRGLYQAGNYKSSTLNILEAWILHTGSGLLGVPAGIKVGHMPLALGNKLFFEHGLQTDDAVVVFADPLKELHLGLLTIKFREGSQNLNDDATGYVGLFAYKTKEFGFSGDVTYVDDQKSYGTAGNKSGPTLGAVPTHFWNFGLRGNINVAGLGIKLDGEMQTGKVDGPDLKFRGYAVLAGLSYTAAPVKLGLDFAYGSGDDSNDGKIKSFVTALDSSQHFTYVYDYRTVNACGQQYGGLCNTMYVKLDASMDVAKDLNAYLALYWLQAAKKISGSVAIGELLGVAANTTSSKSIGTELDAKFTYKIDRNLVYWVEGGYLFAGDYWKTGTKDPDDAFAVRHGIQLSF